MASLILYFEGARGWMLVLGSIAAIFTGKSFAHLWYLYALIGIYLLLPVIKRFVDKADEIELVILIGTLFVLTIIVPSFERMTGINIAFTIPMGYTIFYLLLGYYFSIYIHIKRVWLLIIGIVGLKIILVFAAISGVFVQEFSYNYDNFIIAIDAALIFLLFKKFEGNDISEKIWAFDRLCFTVYLIHPIFIHFFYRYLHITPMYFGGHYKLMMPIFWIIFTLCGFLGSFILKKIPVLNAHIL